MPRYLEDPECHGPANLTINISSMQRFIANIYPERVGIGRQVVVIDASTGQKLFNIEDCILRGDLAFSFDDTKISVILRKPYMNKTSNMGLTVTILDLPSGNELGVLPLSKSLGAPHNTCFTRDGKALVLAFQQHYLANIVCFDTNSRTQLWSTTLGDCKAAHTTGRLLVSASNLYLERRDNTLYLTRRPIIDLPSVTPESSLISSKLCSKLLLGITSRGHLITSEESLSGSHTLQRKLRLLDETSLETIAERDMYPHFKHFPVVAEPSLCYSDDGNRFGLYERRKFECLDSSWRELWAIDTSLYSTGFIKTCWFSSNSTRLAILFSDFWVHFFNGTTGQSLSGTWNSLGN
jgi:hypothetical protein